MEKMRSDEKDPPERVGTEEISSGEPNPEPRPGAEGIKSEEDLLVLYGYKYARIFVTRYSSIFIFI